MPSYRCDPIIHELQNYYASMRAFSAPDAATAANAAKMLLGAVRTNALAAAQGTTLASAIATSKTARPVVGRPTGDARYNPSYRALEAFYLAGPLATLASVCDGLAGDELTALETAVTGRHA